MTDTARMPLYRLSPDRIEPVPPTSFARENIHERTDLQRLLRQQIDILGEDLLVVAEEYALFQDARRRVDLLAVDRTGTLVVIELKRTDDGGHMELQALRYAAMVSTMSFDQLVGAFAHYNDVDADEASARLREWMDASAVAAELSDKVRVILVSADFSTEVTSTVLWLNQQYATDISCYRLVAYRLGDQVLVDLQQIIPLPEAADFQVHQRQKGATAAAARAAEHGRDFTRYDLILADETLRSLSKQGAIKRAVEHLYTVGVPLADIRASIYGRRWLPVRPGAAEELEAAFRREYPGRGGHYWFDLRLVDDEGVAWIMPRFGGLRTEEILTVLSDLAPTDAPLAWRRSASPEPED